MVHEHMPDLLQMVKDFFAGSPLAPDLFLFIERDPAFIERDPANLCRA
jgi:hypothetical protein